MGEFFKGWRRKMGCVTRVMACVFATVWLRSLTAIDMVDYWGRFTVQNWRSFHGTFHWSGGEHGRVIPRAIREGDLIGNIAKSILKRILKFATLGESTGVGIAWEFTIGVNTTLLKRLNSTSGTVQSSFR